MFEDVKRILIEEKDGYLDHKEYSEKEIKRIKEVLDDFENYYKYSIEALFSGWREPTEGGNKGWTVVMLGKACELCKI